MSLTLCDPMDCSPPGSSLHGILQARVLEWVAIAFSKGSSRPREGTQGSRVAGGCFTLCTTREAPLRLSIWQICQFLTYQVKIQNSSCTKMTKLTPFFLWGGGRRLGGMKVKAKKTPAWFQGTLNLVIRIFTAISESWVLYRVVISGLVKSLILPWTVSGSG